MKIMLDPGHAGAFYNRSPVYPAYYESVMTWKLSLLLKDALERRGITVGLTRWNRDDDIELTERGRRAAGYDLFLSIHSNAAASEVPDAPWIIHFSEDSKTTLDERSAEVARLLGPVISKVMGVSAPFYYTRKTDFDRDGNGYLDDEWYGVLFGAKSVGVPGVILEHSFHTNRAAAEWLMSEENLRRLAEAEAEAIASYYGVKKEEDEVTQAEFNAMMKVYLKDTGLSDYVKGTALEARLKEYTTTSALRSAVDSIETVTEYMSRKMGDRPSGYAMEAVAWAKERGLFMGDGQGNYNWSLPIRREDVACVLYRNVYRKLSDVPEGEERQVVKSLTERGIIRGRSGSGEDMVIDLSEEAIRLLVYLERAGVFGDLRSEV